MTTYLTLVFAAGVLAVLYGAVQTAALMKASTGNDKMREIAAAIQEGASAYLKRQYLTIGLVGIVILIAAYLLIGPYAAVGFLIGAVLSGAAGYAGMLISVRANVRTAQAASESLSKGLNLAFRSGASRSETTPTAREASRTCTTGSSYCGAIFTAVCWREVVAPPISNGTL